MICTVPGRFDYGPRLFSKGRGRRSASRHGVLRYLGGIVYQLVITSGPEKGRSWALGEAGLTVGRGAECDIAVRDAVVSRRHCRFFVQGERACVEDLGSRNPAFLNGVPTEEGDLQPGDEVSLGQWRFLLVRVEEGQAEDASDSRATQTWAWEKEEPVSLAAEGAKPSLDPHPKTVHDLALLYEAARELSGCGSEESLEAALARRIVERFRPRRLWLAHLDAGEELRFAAGRLFASVTEQPPPMAMIRRALEERQGLLLARKTPVEPGACGNRGLLFSLACPITLSQLDLAVIAMETEVPHGAFDEEDLQLLVLLCQSVAPILVAVRDVERLRCDNEALQTQVDLSLSLVGRSDAMRQLRNQIAEVAKSDASVLITGETGTGKELAARLLHAQSPRHDQAFVTVNCPAIPRELFESQLFGYEKGAFTGAERRFPGHLAEADGGTLFLDEVGDLAPDNQARLLRAIELGTFRRIGATEDSHVDVRIVSATNKDIPAALKAGALRQDFYHRLGGFEIHMPPLRERRSDIPVLAEHFLHLLQDQAEQPICRISAEALEHLRRQPWPGNVRELRNHIQRAVSVTQGDTVDLDAVQRAAGNSHTGAPPQELLTLSEVEKRHIESVLRQCEGNMSATARALRIGRTTLYKRMAEHNIQA